MDKIAKYADKNYLNKLNNKNIQTASNDIRRFLIENVMVSGGHLASNLGVVELTLALHKVFNFPVDKIIFDVGHQCYIHKILSGRYNEFHTLRQLNGLSGFPKCEESEYDSFNTGHSSTSISAALGMARARDLNNESFNIIAFIGDGAISSGMAFEALNDAGVSNSKIIIILNDNEMSINKNVGGLSKHLSMLRLNPRYIKAKSKMHSLIDRTGVLGKNITYFVRRIKRAIKNATIKVPMFEELGLTYIGLIDGHNFDDIEQALNKAVKVDGSVIIHVSTIKGRGFDDAESDPSSYHGVSPQNISSTLGLETYTDVFGQYLSKKAYTNNRVVSVSAAMRSGCGLDEFVEKHPNRFFDVGIAEEHAVTMCAGLSKGGIIPVFSVYSTFLQRAYDQILHDVCLQNLHVVFAIDRSGIVGEDGETHQGIFDLSFLSHLPNITILVPSCKDELIMCMDYAIDSANGPVAVRYPKSTIPSYKTNSCDISRPHTIKKTGTKILIISIGRMLDIATDTFNLLENNGFDAIHLISMCMVKPIDSSLYDELISDADIVVTIEDNIISGGAGEYLMSCVSCHNKSKIINIGFNSFVQHGTQKELFELHNITPEKIAKIVIERYK